MRGGRGGYLRGGLARQHRVKDHVVALERVYRRADVRDRRAVQTEQVEAAERLQSAHRHADGAETGAGLLDRGGRGYWSEGAGLPDRGGRATGPRGRGYWTEGAGPLDRVGGATGPMGRGYWMQ